MTGNRDRRAEGERRKKRNRKTQPASIAAARTRESQLGTMSDLACSTSCKLFALGHAVTHALKLANVVEAGGSS